MNVGFIHLGCSKNLVDTEMTIGLFKKQGYIIVNEPEKADILVINTCGFIASAKEEAIQTILEMAEYKKKKCKYLIVMGCLVQRYKKELEKLIPEVDVWLAYQTYDTLWEQIEKKIGGRDESNQNIKLCFMDRVITTGENYTYLRIAEGCSNCCTYCAIPSIRGPFQSRTMEDILQEAKSLVEKGYQELIVIAQDTTKYGIDIYGEPKLVELLKELEKIKNLKWIRFLYAYPETITEELIQTVKQSRKICHYFDIPIQHIADPILKRMNRKSRGETIRKLIKRLRKEIPDVIIRTTVMVGFPGETKEDFDELYQFIKEAKFDKLGAFRYSKEENTPAARLKEQIHPMTKKSRYDRIMQLQQNITRENLENKVGNTYEVLIENKTFDGKYYIGRSYMDVPEVDGFIYLPMIDRTLKNKFVMCKITKVQGYDLIGEIMSQKYQG